MSYPARAEGLVNSITHNIYVDITCTFFCVWIHPPDSIHRFSLSLSLSLSLFLRVFLCFSAFISFHATYIYTLSTPTHIRTLTYAHTHTHTHTHTYIYIYIYIYIYRGFTYYNWRETYMQFTNRKFSMALNFGTWENFFFISITHLFSLLYYLYLKKNKNMQIINSVYFSVFCEFST